MEATLVISHKTYKLGRYIIRTSCSVRNEWGAHVTARVTVTRGVLRGEEVLSVSKEFAPAATVKPRWNAAAHWCTLQVEKLEAQLPE